MESSGIAVSRFAVRPNSQFLQTCVRRVVRAVASWVAQNVTDGPGRPFHWHVSHVASGTDLVPRHVPVSVNRLKFFTSDLFPSPPSSSSLSLPPSSREAMASAYGSPKFAHSTKQQEVVIPDLTIKELLDTIP